VKVFCGFLHISQRFFVGLRFLLEIFFVQECNYTKLCFTSQASLYIYLRALYLIYFIYIYYPLNVFVLFGMFLLDHLVKKISDLLNKGVINKDIHDERPQLLLNFTY
jgi:hypothetical protein